MTIRSGLASIAVIGALTAGVTGQQSQPAPGRAPAPLVTVGRSKIATKYGIVAASQPLAARAGVQVLERGGNAIDAAIATNAVMGLVEPYMQRHRRRSLRDLLRGEDRQAARAERRRLGADRADARAAASRRASTRMPASGIYTVTVPGAVAGWERCARGSASCRCPTSSRRRSSTPRTAFPSPT